MGGVASSTMTGSLLAPAAPAAVLASSREAKGVTYRLLERGVDAEALFAFNKTHGSTPYNFIPDGPVREHLGKLASGVALAWGAFDEAGSLAGFITAERG